MYWGCRLGALFGVEGCKWFHDAPPSRVDHKVRSVPVELSLEGPNVLGNPSEAYQFGPRGPSSPFRDLAKPADPGNFDRSGTSNLPGSLQCQPAEEVRNYGLCESRSGATGEELKDLSWHRNEPLSSPTAQHRGEIGTARCVSGQTNRGLCEAEKSGGIQGRQLPRKGTPLFRTDKRGQLGPQKSALPRSALRNVRTLRRLPDGDKFEAAKIRPKSAKSYQPFIQRSKGPRELLGPNQFVPVLKMHVPYPPISGGRMSIEGHRNTARRKRVVDGMAVVAVLFDLSRVLEGLAA